MIKKRNKLGQITKTGKIVKCSFCSQKIYKQLHLLKKNKRFFCNVKCRNNYNKKHLKDNDFLWWNDKKLKQKIIKKLKIKLKGRHLSINTEFKKGNHYSIDTEIKKGEHKSKSTEFKKGHKPTHGWKKGNHFSKSTEQKRIKHSIKSNNKKTIPEKILHKLLNLYFKSFKYTGNGKILIENFNPDFIDTKNKKIIEVFGDYWHNLPKQKRKDYYKFIVYKRNGYKTLVIWEHELKDLNTVKERIYKFSNS